MDATIERHFGNTILTEAIQIAKKDSALFSSSSQLLQVSRFDSCLSAFIQFRLFRFLRALTTSREGTTAYWLPLPPAWRQMAANCHQWSLDHCLTLYCSAVQKTSSSKNSGSVVIGRWSCAKKAKGEQFERQEGGCRLGGWKEVIAMHLSVEIKFRRMDRCSTSHPNPSHLIPSVIVHM